MNEEFPKIENQFLKATMFQDQEIPLRYKGWEKKGNEDVKKKDGALITWKQRLKYQLRYSYPEWALDEAGEKKLDKEGKPIRNKFYDTKFPQGYSILYHFEEGKLESGSLPLFNAFCLVRPKPKEIITILRTGEGQDTKWKVKKCVPGEVQAGGSDVPEVDFSDPSFSGDPEINDEAPF